MLDIIITHYKEPWEVCRGLFMSLDMQRGISWDEIRVTVVNDGGHRLPEDEIRRLRFPVNQADLPHGGISRARNAGIDLGTEPWIMFCDCDDCFANIYALQDIMNVLHADPQFDMLWTHVWEETVGGMVMQIPGFRVFVFCHGKIYRKEFLEKEQIRFEEGLRFNEDSCFNAVICARTNRIGEICSHSPVYAWIRRAGSVTMQDGPEDEATYCNFRRNLIVTEENRLHRPDQYPSMVVRTTVDAFYMIHSRRISESCKQKILEEFRNWITEKVAGEARVMEGTKIDRPLLEKIREISKSELTEPGEDFPDGITQIMDWVRETIR